MNAREKTSVVRPHRDKLLGIQVVRGAAALLVVVYHAGRMIALPQYVGFIPLGDAFGFGHAGVDFFFVLSGFIIYFVHHRDIGRPARLPTYAWRRLTRIYPIYWVATALVLALAVLSHGAAGWPETGYLARSLLLLPQPVDPLLGVAWTLEHEMLFYLIFALAIADRRLGAAVFAAWFAWILIGLAMSGSYAPALDARGLGMPAPAMPTGENGVGRFVADPVHLQFFMGIAAAHLVLTGAPGGRGGRALALAAAGAGAFLAAGIAENAGLFSRSGLASQGLFAAASVCVLVGLARAERAGMVRAGPLAALFGAASYALYLIHTLAIGVAAHLMEIAGLTRALPGAAVMAATVLAALAAGALLHLLVERPMMARINRPGRRPGRTEKARPGAAAPRR